MVATSWAPYYFDEVWPLSGRSPLDTSIAMAARILYAVGILHSVHSGDLIAALPLPPSYARDFVRVLARNKWEHRLLPSLIEATRYQLTSEGMYDVLEATQANDQPLREANGNVSGIIVLGVDVTDRKMAQDALLQAEKLAAVGLMASSGLPDLLYQRDW